MCLPEMHNASCLGYMFLFLFGGIINSHPVAAIDRVDQPIGSLELQDQTFMDGLAKLNAVTDFGFSLELILKPSLSAPNPENPHFSSRIDNATLREALNWLFQLDERYTWLEEERIINVVPKGRLEAGDGFFLNRKIASIEYLNVRSWSDAVFFTVGQLPGPKEQIAIMQVGGSADFPKPLCARLTNVSVRQAFNVIARQCGNGWGWTLTGTPVDFRVVKFHQRLAVAQGRH